MCTGHTDISNISCTFRQDSLIGSWDVGVGAEDATYPSIEMVTHCDFFAGGLGVEVNEYDIGFLFELGQDFVNGIIWAVSRLHKKATYQRKDADCWSFAGLLNCNSSSRGMFGKICGSGDIVGCLQRLNNVSFTVCVVAQGNQVHAVSEQFVVDLRCQARAAGGILSVGYYAVDAKLSNQLF
jgi:hypothetical protein